MPPCWGLDCATNHALSDAPGDRVVGAIGVVAQGKGRGEGDHRVVGRLVVDAIDRLDGGGVDVGGVTVGILGEARFLSFHALAG